MTFAILPYFYSVKYVQNEKKAKKQASVFEKVPLTEKLLHFSPTFDGLVR